MSQERYCIHRFYRERKVSEHHDDTFLKDECQLEVYLHALGLMKKYKLHSIIDIGCGSAYKLVTYLGEYETTGIEIPQTHEWLTNNYPNRRWLVSDFTMGKNLSADLIICSDVIEHLNDPDELISFIKDICFQYLIISTPSRDLLFRPLRWIEIWKRYWIWIDFVRCYWISRFIGPPENRAHVREWSFKEFNKYISLHFYIIKHMIVNETQIVICRPKI